MNYSPYNKRIHSILSNRINDMRDVLYHINNASLEACAYKNV